MFEFNKFCLSDLKLKLEQARSLVDNEAEHERDKLDNQFRLLRQLLLETDGVDEGTLRRVKILEDPVVSLPSSPSQGYPNIISPGLMSLREGLNKPSGKRRSVNMTEESVFDVDDLNLRRREEEPEQEDPGDPLPSSSSQENPNIISPSSFKFFGFKMVMKNYK